MQVKEGSWYQAVNKSLYQVRVSCGHNWLFSTKGDATGVAVLSGGRSHLGIPGAPHDLLREVSDPTKPVQLRVGGKYLDSSGNERELEPTPPEDRYVETHPFRAVGTKLTYRADGKTHAYGMDDIGYDLICEILDPATEPELVFVAGEVYECRNGESREFVGESQFGANGKCLVFSCEAGNLSRHYKNGRWLREGDYCHDIVRPWIDPPTEFVDPRNGKRYRVGEEIK